MDPIIISYFTKNTLYEKDAARLKSSCETFGLEHCIEGIEPFGQWHHHTCYKAVYILQKMQQLGRPVVWIDADAEIVQTPTLFSQLHCDISLRLFNDYPKDHPCYAYTATIYFNHTPSAVTLVRTWATQCEQVIREKQVKSDQQLLGPLLETVHVSPLPIGYAAVFEEPIPSDERFITQYQASRLYKNIINGEIACSFLEQLSIDDLRSLTPRLLQPKTKGAK